MRLSLLQFTAMCDSDHVSRTGSSGIDIGIPVRVRITHHARRTIVRVSEFQRARPLQISKYPFHCSPMYVAMAIVESANVIHGECDVLSRPLRQVQQTAHRFLERYFSDKRVFFSYLLHGQFPPRPNSSGFYKPPLSPSVGRHLWMTPKDRVNQSLKCCRNFLQP